MSNIKTLANHSALDFVLIVYTAVGAMVGLNIIWEIISRMDYQLVIIQSVGGEIDVT